MTVAAPDIAGCRHARYHVADNHTTDRSYRVKQSSSGGASTGSTSSRGASPTRIALVAVLIALTVVLTKVVQIPIPASQGYWNLSDAATSFAGFAFGPFVGFAAGGVGTAIADLLSGPYAIWAPISLLAHGLEGAVIGFLVLRSRRLPNLIFAYAAGAIVMVVIYLLGGAVLKGFEAALAEVPFNALQGVVGGVVGIPLYLAVRRAYPAIDRMGRRQTWTE